MNITSWLRSVEEAKIALLHYTQGLWNRADQFFAPFYATGHTRWRSTPLPTQESSGSHTGSEDDVSSSDSTACNDTASTEDTSQYSHASAISLNSRHSRTPGSTTSICSSNTASLPIPHNNSSTHTRHHHVPSQV
jgi:hypothetical protein